MASHYLQVSEVHKIHYQIIGDDNDPPLILIHGGPGVGCTENDLRFVLDLGVRAILIDQRGCGRSTPKGSVLDNTTQYLIDDIVAVMDDLGINKAKILGGSWGSTLAILFTMQHPDKVDILLLRGLFMATKKSWVAYEDKNTDAYRHLSSMLPDNYKINIWRFYYEKLISGNADDQEKYARYFAEFNLQKITEGKVIALEANVNINEILAINRIKLHYMVNDFFIEDDYIWKRISSLQGLPITVIHGIHDEICDPFAVKKFAAQLPNVSIMWVKAGHSPKDDAIVKAVRSAVSNKMIN